MHKNIQITKNAYHVKVAHNLNYNNFQNDLIF